MACDMNDMDTVGKRVKSSSYDNASDVVHWDRVHGVDDVWSG